MDISAAAIPPRQPHISEKDRTHPLFSKYMSYRSAMTRQLVQADSFDNWLGQIEMAKRDAELAKDPQLKAFQQWMAETQGGAPGKTELRWPHNFHAWKNGTRW